MKLSSIALALPLLLAPAQAFAGEILSVKTSSANFRENPHEAAKIKFSADKFFPVEAIEHKKGWVKVKDFEGDVAWVSEKMLGKQATIVVSTDHANIRENASTSSDVVFKVERGEVFKIESRKGDWLQVLDARGDGGWIRADMTWGDPERQAKEDDKKAEKKEEPAKGIEADKPKPQSDSPAKAKEAEPTKPVVVEETIEVKLAKAEYLRALCDSYVHYVWEGTMTPPSDLEVLCRTLLKDMKHTKADKPKAEKGTAEKPKAQKSDKPKPQKKADKPKPAGKPTK